MLTYESAKQLYDEIKEMAQQNPDEDLQSIYRMLLEGAVTYAQNRTAWAFMTADEKAKDDKSRSAKHDGYMAMLGAVCRNLGIEGIDEKMPDRKTKGDFACYIALFLALEER